MSLFSSFKPKYFAFIGIILFASLGAFNFYVNHYTLRHVPVLDFSEFVKEVDKGNIKQVTIRGDTIIGRYKNEGIFTTYKPGYEASLIPRLLEKDIRIRAEAPEEPSGSFLHLFLSWLPMFFLLGIWTMFLRQIHQGTGRAMGFGRSKAKTLEEGKTTITFDDVAGIDEAKEDVKEIVAFLKEPEKFSALGAKIPRGVLLIGPPGTGKTLLAKAIAGEANVPFLFISGSDFVEMFVGVGASRVRDLFEQAKEKGPCIIFVDEIDAVGRHRGIGLGGGNDEREQTLNQLLVEMDGFQENQGVIVIAATNRPDILDPALLRPGRFDRQILVNKPDLKEREKILLVHMRGIVLAEDVDPKILARRTPGLSGADLANIVNEAAIFAGRREAKSVTAQDFEYAMDKSMMGHERKTLVMSPEERKLTAYHEAGHAVVAMHSPSSDPIHKATILARGRALGLVMRLPERDTVSVSRIKLMGDMAVGYGGRVAEELIFGADNVTTGASSDIQMITETARRMVTEWGMSDRVGPLHYAEGNESFLGHLHAGEGRRFSEDTARTIDEEVKDIVKNAYQVAKNILTTYIHHLHAVAEALLEKETLTGQEIQLLIQEAQPNTERVLV